MAWSDPTPPVSGTTITRAYAIANIVDPVLWLRALTGGDPAGANAWLQSTGVDGATWVARATAVRDAMATAILTARILLSNNISLQGQDAAGVPRGLAGVGPDDVVYLGDAANVMKLQTNGTLQVWTGASYQTVYHTGNLPAGGATVPSGLIAAFPNAATIAAGWTRFTNLDGRIPVGAGTTFGQTFVEGASAGSSWAHQHDGSALTTNSVSAGSVSSGGGSTATPAHSHTISGNTANTSWIPPMFTIVWAIKS